MSPRALLLASSLLVALPLGGLAHAREDDGGTTVGALTVEGERAQATAGATGLSLTLRETPQSVTRIDAERIEDFALTDVNVLLSGVVGVNVEAVETDRTYFNSRGFDIASFQVDGVGLPLIWGIQFGALDTAIFERVEVIRGANGMAAGVGNPSATVNYVRKRPTPEARGRGSASYGAWDQRRLELDISGPLDSAGTLAGRLVYANTDGDSWLDYNHVKRNVLYGVATWEVSRDLTLTAGYSWQENLSDGVLWGSLPLTWSDGTRIRYDRSASTSADWTYWDTRDQSGFLEARYALAGGWSARASYTRRVFDENAKLLYAFGYPDPVTGLGVAGMSGRYPSRYEQDLFAAEASGPLTLFGREHEVVLGVTAAEGDGREHEDFAAVFPAYPAVQDWGRLQVAEPAYPGAYLAADTTDRLNRLYGAARLNLSDRLKAVVGFNAIDLESSGFSYGADQARSETKVSPYAGVVFDLDARLSLYASYSDIFNPQSEVDVTHRRLDAAQGRSWEAGIKGEWFGGRLYASAAVFRAEQSNLAEWAGTFPGGQSYHRGVDTTAEGYELEVAGAIGDRWTLAGGWTQLSVEDAAGTDTRTFLPRRSLKLTTTWSVPEARGLKLGAAVRWQDETTLQDLVLIRQAPYTVVDVMGGFDLTPSVRATVNVRNLLDETYLTSLMWNQSWYASPRAASVRLDWRF